MKISCSLYLSFAFLLVVLASPATALKIPAKDCKIKTVGGEQEGVWNLWSNGDVGDYFFFPKAGTYKVRVRARGTPVRKIWPLMALSKDGLALERIPVDSDSFREYEFSFDAEASVYRLTVSFLNDGVTDEEDRNLYLDWIEIRPSGKLAEPHITTGEEWERLNEEEESAALKKAEAGIEEFRKRDLLVRILDKAGKTLQGALVEAEQTNHDFLFGCNIFMFDRFPTVQENEAYKKLFRELFNYATLGFYWASYEPAKGQPKGLPPPLGLAGGVAWSFWVAPIGLPLRLRNQHRGCCRAHIPARRFGSNRLLAQPVRSP